MKALFFVTICVFFFSNFLYTSPANAIEDVRNPLTTLKQEASKVIGIPKFLRKKGSEFNTDLKTIDKITPKELASAISENIHKVEEFKFIRDSANELGVKVSLAEDSAAIFAHHNKWLLQYERGDNSFLKGRMNLNFLNIYPEFSDLELKFFVEGEEGDIQKLKKQLDKHFLYFKSRFIKNDQAKNLVSEFDNIKIPITDSTKRINAESPFIKSVYHSQINITKSSAIAANIFDVLDILYYAGLSNSEISQESKNILSNIIENFSYKSDLDTRLLTDDFSKRISRILDYSVDLEATLSLIGELDKEDKLNYRRFSVLPSSVIGEGRGLSAKTQKVEIVTHGTSNHRAWVAITRHPKGKVNALMSIRQNTATDETSVRRGDGFYTMKGKNNVFDASRNKYLINMEVAPHSRSGPKKSSKTDYYSYEDERIFLNSKSLKRLDFEALDPVSVFTQTDWKKRELTSDIIKNKNKVIRELTVNQSARSAVDDFMNSNIDVFLKGNYFHIYDYYLSLPDNTEVSNNVNKKITAHLLEGLNNFETIHKNSFSRIYYSWINSSHAQRYPEVVESLLSNRGNEMPYKIDLNLPNVGWIKEIQNRERNCMELTSEFITSGL